MTCDYPGELLLSVSFTSPLTCLALDPAETVAWVADQSGGIHRLGLLSPPRDVSVTRSDVNGTKFLEFET